ncbi:hypothetical protein [Alkaliphilus transvaalensis]|uniref:hypothetical protein n=1 Tax=Alkaliphilus transvaalensis TaxID=114628 RepID=UPI00047A6099|nr:hypothetical protein [Alkaliphilus transvaalensis]
MRHLSDTEVLALTGLLRMEKDGLAVSRALEAIITDDDLRKETQAGVLAAEGRIQAIQQFINENHVTTTEEVR